jgi:ADP-heptose:LPS heptosyltransferase
LERYLAVASFIGCGRAPVEFVFATDQADRAFAFSLTGGFERYALLFPGTNWPTKRWPIEKLRRPCAAHRAEAGPAMFRRRRAG